MTIEMKFKVDENLPVDMARLFTEAGHDALTVFDEELSGEVDRKIEKICQEEERILITLDIGFADIRAYPPAEFSGLIVLRIQRQDKKQVLQVGRRLLRMLEKEQVEKRLWIVDEYRMRIRG